MDAGNATNDFDLIVVGGGPMGLSTAWHATQRQLRTLVVDQGDFLNNDGSSAGASRQFRIQYSQQYMSELVLSSIPYWNDLQQHSGDVLRGTGGSLWFGDPSLSSQEGGIDAAMNTLTNLGVPFKPLANAAAIEDRFGFNNIPTEYSGFFQPDGGIIDLKATQQAMITAAQASGFATFKANCGVVGIEPGETITVATVDGEYTTSQLAITAGPYTNDVLTYLGLSIDLDIWEMSSAYYKLREAAAPLPTWFVFQKPQDTSLFYGFPAVSWANPGYIRVAPDIPDRHLTDPSQRSGEPSAKSLALNEAWVRDHMPGLDPTSTSASTCLIALTKGANPKEFLLDHPPATSVAGASNIVIQTAGWGAKFIPIMGELVCRMLADPTLTTFDFGDYSIDRSNFAITWAGQNTPAHNAGDIDLTETAATTSPAAKSTGDTT